ncbi:MBL fold metallo-hydrolase [Microbispora rosea]|uniref:MBL fold metallo-hydrolase n=1 Tax=Microbispora rosea TaxID=58117 RepID=UPI0034224D1B
MSSTATGSAQAPGFARTSVGAITVTTVYDGALPIFAADMHGESSERITELLADGFLPPEGDLMTAVNTFLFQTGGRTVLVDAGAGTSLGPGTGHLQDNLRAAGVCPEQVDDVLITHLHPDHAFGLVPAPPAHASWMRSGRGDGWSGARIYPSPASGASDSGTGRLGGCPRRIVRCSPHDHHPCLRTRRPHAAASARCHTEGRLPAGPGHPGDET